MTNEPIQTEQQTVAFQPTADKILAVVAVYEDLILLRGGAWEPAEPLDLSGICEAIRSHIKEGRTAQAVGWLGFMSGALWMDGNLTVEELHAHNAIIQGFALSVTRKAFPQPDKEATP